MMNPAAPASRRRSPFLLGTLLLLSVTAAYILWDSRASSSADVIPAGVEVLPDAQGGFEVIQVADGFALPWDLAFLSSTEALVTEKAGTLQRVDLATGRRRAVSGMPAVTVQGQGGLHTVILHPRFAENGLIYFSYAATAVDGTGAVTHFMRAKLSGTTLSEQQLLLRAKAPTEKGQHFGGAMVFDLAGYLFVSVGERGERDDAQLLDRHNGKILRLRDDGRVPDDNPFVGRAGALPEIWSYGHRNPQGLSLDPLTGTIWETEHGPQGGDEVNRIVRGRNYGWPVITYGREYGTGFQIGEGTTRKDVAPPAHYYVPSIATCGVAFYGADRFPQWKGSLFVAALRGHLNRVEFAADGTFAKEQRFLSDRKTRIRSVRISPEGEPHLLTDTGLLLKLVPRAAGAAVSTH